MSRERRPGLGGITGGAIGRSTGSLGAPGKRTLTQGLVQRKARAVWTGEPATAHDESRAPLGREGGEAAAQAHTGATVGHSPATIDAPAAWDESLGRPTIAIASGAVGEGAAGEVAASGAAEPGWVQRARAYHEAHAAAVAEFDRLTGGACAGDDGGLDPRKVARWQAEHGAAPDGRVGEATLDAARATGRGAGGGGDRAATSEPVSIDAPARYDEVDRGTLEVGEPGAAAPVAPAGGDRAATSEPVSIDAPARYDEVDRGTLALGGAVQRRAVRAGVSAEGEGDPVSVAAAGVEGAAQPLPHLAAIQASFGPHDVSGVRAQVGGAAAEASDALGAEAYATGDRVGFAASPSLHTAAHEAAHVVQQRAGVQLKGGVGQAGDAYEQHADAVADAVARGESAADLLGQVRAAPAGEARVQRKESASSADARVRRAIEHLLRTLDELESFLLAPGGAAYASRNLQSLADSATTVAAQVDQHGASLTDETWQRFDEVMRRTADLAGALDRDAGETVKKVRERMAKAAIAHDHEISYVASPRSDVGRSSSEDHVDQLRSIVETVEARVTGARAAMGQSDEVAVLAGVATSVSGMLRQARRHVAAAATGSRMARYAEVVEGLELPLVDLFTWGRKAGAALSESGLADVFDVADELRFDVGLSKLKRSEAYYADQKPPGGDDDGAELVKKLISVWKDRAMLSDLLGYEQLETMLSEPPPAPDPDLMTTLLKTFAQSVVVFASGPLAELVQLGLGVHAVESVGGDMAKTAVGHLTGALRGMATGSMTEATSSGSPKTRFFDLIRQGLVHKISMAGASLIDIEPQLRRLPPAVLQEMFDWMRDRKAFKDIWGEIIARVVSEWLNFCAAARHGVSDPEQARHLTLDADRRDGETVGGTLERVSNRDALVNVVVHVRESEEGPVLRLGDATIPSATDKMVTTLRDTKTPLARLEMHRWIHLLPSGGQIYLDASHAIDLGWARRGFLARIGREEVAAGRGTFGEVIEQSEHASDQDVQAGVDRVLELLQRATTAKLQGA